MADKYKVVRMFQNHSSRAVRGLGNLSLLEAQAHCRSREATWKTCTSYAGRKRTERMGPWFEGYDNA